VVSRSQDPIAPSAYEDDIETRANLGRADLESVSRVVSGEAHCSASALLVHAGRRSLKNSMKTQKVTCVPVLLLAAILPCLGAGAGDLDRLVDCFEAGPFDPEPAAQAFEAFVGQEPENLVGLFKRCGVVDPWTEAMRWTIASAGPTAIPGLRSALTSRFRTIRSQAAEALLECDAATRKALLPDLIKALEESDERGIDMVSQVLASMGEDALPAFVTLTNRLATLPMPWRCYLVHPVVNFGSAAEPAMPWVRQALPRGNGGTFGEMVLNALGGPRADPDLVVPLLIETLKHRDWLMRRAAALALERQGEAARSAAPTLKRVLLTDEDPRVRWALAMALAVVEPAETEIAVQALVEVLQDESEAAGYSPQHAAHALGGLGIAARPALPVLLQLLEDHAEIVLEEAQRGGLDSDAKDLVLGVLHALGALGSEAQAALPTLERLAAEGDFLVVVSAQQARLRVAPDNRSLLDSLLDQAASPDPKQCQQAIRVLAGLRPMLPEVQTVLLTLLQHDQWEIRLHAAMVVSKTGPNREKVRAILVSGLNHRDSYLRSRVKEALEQSISDRSSR